MLYRRGGEKPELGQIKELKCSGAALAAIVERQGRKGWHIADGRHGSDDLRDKFRKSHIAQAVEVGNSGGAKTVTPSGSLNVDNKTATGSTTVNNTTAGGSVGINNTTAGGSVTVNNHTLSKSQIPAHNHAGSYLQRKTSDGTSTAGARAGTSTSGSFPLSVASDGSGGAHNHGGSFSGSAHNHSGSFSGSAHNHGSSVVVNAHNHSGTLNGQSQNNEPQHIIVLVLQYTGQKIQGVTP